ncbi:MAG: Ldh family oxidoreductase, partial [Gammaproteobacteria bacterium]|nr:Ldh family oxidoreductase [Gammaproteobacteria bacterium]
GNALAVADALVAAEMDGQSGHGLSRVPYYAAQSASGKVNGHAMPCAEQVGDAAWRIDACHGFAYPAIDLAIEKLLATAPGSVIGIATVFHSHHAGQAGYHVERLARRGLLGLLFSNTPRAIAPWGGTQPLFGTNPIACAVPRATRGPLVIDTSLSRVARGKIMLADREGRRLPEGWALDARGQPTSDPGEALSGSLLPMGEAKGAALALMVEILAAALSGALFGFEATSFFTGDGAPPGVGQTLIAIDPEPLAAGTFATRLETLLDAILAQQGTRLPGAGKAARRERALREGIVCPASLHEELLQLAAPTARQS